MTDSANTNDELELVGFEGKMIKDCARYSPIVRRKECHLIFRLTPHKQQEQFHRFYSQEDIQHSPVKDIITLLDKPMEINSGEMVLFLSDVFLHAVNKDLSSEIRSQPIGKGKIYLLNEEKINAILDEFAELLMNRATEEIILYFTDSPQIHHKKATEYINLARQAALSKELRPNIFLRYGVISKYSLTPEKLENVFQLRIKNEFPTWTWESFQQKVDSLASTLYTQALLRKPRPVRIDSSNYIDTSTVHTIAEAGPPNSYMRLDINELILLPAGLSEHERLRKCVIMAEKIRGIYPVNLKQIKEIGNELLSIDYIRLSQEKLQVVAGEPAFHFLISSPQFNSAVRILKSSRPDAGPMLSSIKYRMAARELINCDINPGEITEYIFDHLGLADKAVS